MTGKTSGTNLASEPTESQLDTILLAINRLGRDSGYLRVQDVEQTLHRKTLAQIPDDWRTVSRSINAGEPLYLYAPNSKIRDCLVELAMRLAENNPVLNNQSRAQKVSQNHKLTRQRRGQEASLLGRILRGAAVLTHTARGDQPLRKKAPRPLADIVHKEVPKH